MNHNQLSTPIKAVLFDLDGTLLHTAPDITAGVNGMLKGLNLPALPELVVTNLIGKGSPILVERVLSLQGASLSASELALAIDSFQEQYENIVGTHATLYPGTMAALQELHAMGNIKLAVVTNKYHRFAMHLLQQFKIASMFDLVVGGDTLAVRKPNPEPLLHACRSMGVEVAETIYIGDSINDVEAATAAGIPVYCVPHGYNEGNPASSLPCTGLIDSIANVPELVRIRANPARQKDLKLA